MQMTEPGARQHPAKLPQTLLIDADDTLWENGLYFEQAIARFISYLDHKQHSPAEVREHLNQAERATIARHGYGLKSFRASLTGCLESLLSTTASSEQHAALNQFVEHISEHEMQLLDGVSDTLWELAGRHTLLLVTKGNHAEQTRKLNQSGLTGYFAEVEVLAEKHEAAYRELVARYGLDPQNTWMIGNSPRSDINPALAAGLHAVLIPHPHTWVLEQEPVDQALRQQRLLQLRSFRELSLHF